MTSSGILTSPLKPDITWLTLGDRFYTIISGCNVTSLRNEICQTSIFDYQQIWKSRNHTLLVLFIQLFNDKETYLTIRKKLFSISNFSLSGIFSYIIVRQRDQGIYGLFRNLRALGCSVPSAARALLRARRFLNRP